LPFGISAKGGAEGGGIKVSLISPNVAHDQILRFAQNRFTDYKLTGIIFSLACNIAFCYIFYFKTEKPGVKNENESSASGRNWQAAGGGGDTNPGSR
jgi:hypothetical protein